MIYCVMGLMHAQNRPLELDRMRFPLLASEKLDGWRMLVIARELLTKSCGDFPNRNLKSHFAELLELTRQGWVFDCECYSSRMSLAELQSILQSRTAPIPDHVHAHVFDCLTITEWFSSRAPRFERRVERLNELLTRHAPRHTTIIPHLSIADADDLLALYEGTIAEGVEGLMLRDPRGGYFHGRVPVRKGLIWKMKPQTMLIPA